MIWIILCYIYIGVLVGNLLPGTRFVLPRSLWILVPFRVSGWKSILNDGKVYKINWVWDKIDFNKFYIEVKK